MRSDGTAASHASTLQIRLYPLPSATHTLSFDVRLRAPRFAVADLGTDDTNSTTPMVVAADMIEAVVRPLFIERWSACPWFRNKEARPQIAQDAKEARGLLEQYRPQQESSRRFATPI